MRSTRRLAALTALALAWGTPSFGQTIPAAPAEGSACAVAVASASELNAFALFAGAAACANDTRVEDVLYLLLSGQSRANADMLVLRPTAGFEPRLFDLVLDRTYGIGGFGFDPLFYLVGLYRAFGDQPFDALFRNAASVDALLQRVRDTPMPLLPGYDPGWSYWSPSDAGIYDLAIASDRENRASSIRSFAFLMDDDRYFSAQLQIMDLVRRNTGTVIDGADLFALLDPIEDTLLALFTQSNTPLTDRQVASGFNGPAQRGTLLLLSEEDLRQSWLPHALSEQELASLLSTTDFTRDALVIYSVGRRTNSSGSIVLSDLYYSSGAGTPENDGYGISVMVGVVPETCGIAEAESYPFVVARIAAMPGTIRINSSGESNFPSECGAAVVGAPTAP